MHTTGQNDGDGEQIDSIAANNTQERTRSEQVSCSSRSTIQSINLISGITNVRTAVATPNMRGDKWTAFSNYIVAILVWVFLTILMSYTK